MTPRMQSGIGWLLLGALAVGLWLWSRPPKPGAAGRAVGERTCLPQQRGGPAGRDDVQTADGLRLIVVTPADYDPTRGYPLLVVYPPAGFSPSAAERLYGLTEDATGHGWIVAYSASLPLSRRAVGLQGAVPATVMQRWCIDPNRIAYLGHSDGGSLAQQVALRTPADVPLPSAIVSSAAGLDEAALREERCPAWRAPIAITLLHNPDDERFPGYGAQAARWWAACLGCSLPGSAPTKGACVEANCDGGSTLRHCATPEWHTVWPAMAHGALGWLARAAVAPGAADTAPTAGSSESLREVSRQPPR